MKIDRLLSHFLIHEVMSVAFIRVTWVWGREHDVPAWIVFSTGSLLLPALVPFLALFWTAFSHFPCCPHRVDLAQSSSCSLYLCLSLPPSLMPIIYFCLSYPLSLFSSLLFSLSPSLSPCTCCSLFRVGGVGLFGPQRLQVTEAVSTILSDTHSSPRPHSHLHLYSLAISIHIHSRSHCIYTHSH